MTNITIQEGGECPEKCEGTLRLPDPVNCSCHISPPCSACTDIRLACDQCGWENEPPSIEPSRSSVPHFWESRSAPSTDLGKGKRIFDYDYDSSSGSTMVFKGRYEGDVTASDIIKALGDGTFGHRGPTFVGDRHSGRFTYTKITD